MTAQKKKTALRVPSPNWSGSHPKTQKWKFQIYAPQTKISEESFFFVLEKQKASMGLA
jgi:hypothetical protein